MTDRGSHDALNTKAKCATALKDADESETQLGMVKGIFERKLFFTPRHDFFNLDAGALRENCFCPIPSVAYSEIRPLCATLALVSGKRPALVQSSSRST